MINLDGLDGVLDELGCKIRVFEDGDDAEREASWIHSSEIEAKRCCQKINMARAWSQKVAAFRQRPQLATACFWLCPINNAACADWRPMPRLLSCLPIQRPKRAVQLVFWLFQPWLSDSRSLPNSLLLHPAWSDIQVVLGAIP